MALDIYPAVPQLASQVRTVTGTATITDGDGLLICNSATPFTATLPAASAFVNKAYAVKNINTGVVTLASGASLIDGVANYLLDGGGIMIVIQSDGTTWRII